MWRTKTNQKYEMRTKNEAFLQLHNAFCNQDTDTAFFTTQTQRLAQPHKHSSFLSKKYLHPETSGHSFH